jgi:hypothetical protein
MNLAALCTRKQLHASAAGLFLEELTANPDKNGIWFNAACAAALAGSGVGDEAAKLDDAARARWRGHALKWMRADLGFRRQTLERGTPQVRESVRRTLQVWKTNPQLAGVRGADAITKLPADEREAWQKFWSEVEALLKQVQAGPP